MKPGKTRKGIFDILSSPADTDGEHNDKAYEFWKRSDPKDIDPETGSTKTRIMRLYSNPLDGIEGFYDKYGDADPQEIFEHIHRERKNKPKDERMEEIRGYPLPILGTNEPDEEELFGATDTGTSIFLNSANFKKQIVTIKENEQELVEYGNYEWPNNVEFSGIPVFRRADITGFDDERARWCRTFANIPRIETSADIRMPPSEADTQGTIGIDPYNNVHRTKNPDKQSMGAAIPWMFRNFSGYGITDLLPAGIIDVPLGAYLARPWHSKIFYDDMVKYCIATGFRIQYEDSDNEQLWKYFSDNDMLDWLIDSRSDKPIETPLGNFRRKGDSPSGRGAKAFTLELKNLIDGMLNVPYNDNEPYPLLHFNIWQVLDDLLKLDLSHTQDRHFSMALGQALLGRGKLLTRRSNKPSKEYADIMKEWVGNM